MTTDQTHWINIYKKCIDELDYMIEEIVVDSVSVDPEYMYKYSDDDYWMAVDEYRDLKDFTDRILPRIFNEIGRKYQIEYHWFVSTPWRWSGGCQRLNLREKIYYGHITQIRVITRENQLKTKEIS